MKKQKKPICILMIPPQELPIPALGGGAIETLITHLLDENEVEQRFRIIVVSVCDPEAEKIEYNFSKVYYNDNGKIKCSFYKVIQIKFFLLRIVNMIKRIIRHLGIEISQVYYPDFFYFQCAQICKKENVEIVISENDTNTEEYRVFYKLVGKENIYFHLHCEMKENLQIRNAIPNSISISRYVRDQWVKKKDIIGENLVIYNCIDINRFNSIISDDKRKKLRHELCVADNETLVLYCGRLIPEKGIDKLLDAFELLKGLPIKLLVIGSVKFSKKFNTDFSRSIIDRAESMDSVIYLGYVSNECITDYYKISDIQVVPSVWQEGAGLVCIEGMASGLPLIVTDSGGMVEYVSDDCAIKIPINDSLSKNIAKAISDLSVEKTLCEQMSSAGKQRAKLFSKEKYYQSFLNAFDSR